MANGCDILDLNNKTFDKEEMLEMANLCLYSSYRDFDPNEFIVGNISKKLFYNKPNIYLNSNENLIMKELISEGDNFLSVLGCGDFALDAVYHGAKEVVTFDINRFQYPMALLRFLALKNLEYDDFWNFFCEPGSYDYLSYSIYEKLRGSNDHNLLFTFWDYLMKIRKDEQERIINDPNFRKMHDMKDIQNYYNQLMGNSCGNVSQVKFDRMMSSLNYDYQPSLIFNMLRTYGCKKTEGSYNFSLENYEETREKLKKSKVSFIESDINSLKDKLLLSREFSKYSFDGFKSIYLSNVPEYMSGDNFASAVSEQLIPLLRDDGVIVYCCQGVSEDVLTKSTKLDILDRKKILPYMLGRRGLCMAQEINDIEGFQNIRQLYDVSTVSTDTYVEGNGNSNTDVFVYIKKNK